MKKTFLIVALFTWIGFSASAQITKDTATTETRTDSNKRIEPKMDPQMDSIDMRNDHWKKNSSRMDSMNHYWIFRDGKVMEVKDGREEEMTTETEVNGVWIRTNGEVVMKNDKVVSLKEGQYLDKEGKIHKMKDKMKDKDKMKKDKM
jgi:hypothetical protein